MNCWAGDYGPESDIELYVMDDDTASREVELFTWHGVIIHRHIVSAVDLQRRRTIDSVIEPPFARCRIVVDRDGSLQRLKATDRQLALAGRHPLTRKEEHVMRVELSMTAEELENTIQDEGVTRGTIELIANRAVHEAIRVSYAHRRRWLVTTSRLLDDLEDADAHLGSLVESALSATRPREKVAGIINIIEYVLSPWGGRWFAPERW